MGVGISVGYEVGWIVGSIDGMGVGISVGYEVGWIVGLIDGMGVEISVGYEVGWMVGMIDDMGEWAVGEGEGDAVTHSQTLLFMWTVLSFFGVAARAVASISATLFIGGTMNSLYGGRKVQSVHFSSGRTQHSTIRQRATMLWNINCKKLNWIMCWHICLPKLFKVEESCTSGKTPTRVVTSSGWLSRASLTLGSEKLNTAFIPVFFQNIDWVKCWV
jgi:hypothetical protein